APALPLGAREAARGRGRRRRAGDPPPPAGRRARPHALAEGEQAVRARRLMDLDAAAGRSPLDGPLAGLRSYASVQDDDERAWIRGAQAGSLDAMERLYRAHWPRAYRAAYLVVHDAAGAEDIAQEAFLAALRALDRFDRRRPFGPWLHRIVVNRAIDWARARTLRRESGEVGLESAAAAPTPD